MNFDASTTIYEAQIAPAIAIKPPLMPISTMFTLKCIQMQYTHSRADATTAHQRAGF